MSINEKTILDYDVDKLVKELLKPTRTSFKLSKETAEALDLLVKYTDSSTYKYLFFTLMINSIKDGEFKHFKKDSKQSAKEYIRKTYVIPESALNWLNNVSKENKIPRDQLLENLIINEKNRIEPIIIERRNKIATIRDLIDKHDEAFDNVTNKIIELFGEDDTILEEWYNGTCVFNREEGGEL